MLSTAWRISKLCAETVNLKFSSISEIQYCTAYYLLAYFEVKSCKERKVYHPLQLVNKYCTFLLQCSQLSLRTHWIFFVDVVFAIVTKWMLLEGCNYCSSTIIVNSLSLCPRTAVCSNALPAIHSDSWSPESVLHHCSEKFRGASSPPLSNMTVSCRSCFIVSSCRN